MPRNEVSHRRSSVELSDETKLAALFAAKKRMSGGTITLTTISASAARALDVGPSVLKAYISTLSDETRIALGLPAKNPALSRYSRS